jgi:cell shape-determining protein MreC
MVAPDESVSTSGEDRAVFPAGIPIGRVTKSELAPAQLTQILTVTPSVDLTRLTFLKVLRWLPAP